MSRFAGIDFLNSLINHEKGFAEYKTQNYDPNLVNTLLDKAGASSDGLKIVHIAGTNGKGSLAYAVMNLLSASGYKSGLYTSPHLLSVTERIRIDGEAISEARLDELASEYRPLIESERPSFFEALTFLAVLHFIRDSCEWVVLETGLGGRLDATNFCVPRITAITPISLDHTAMLGNTLPEIATEKAGIIKRNCPVIVARQTDEALSVLRRVAGERDAPLLYFPESVHYTIRNRNPEGSTLYADFQAGQYDFEIRDLRYPFMGDALAENFLMALLIVSQAGVEPDERRVRQAARKSLTARMQWIDERSLIDVSHNPAGLRFLFETLKAYLPDTREKRLYLGLLRDRVSADMAELIREYVGLFESLTLYDFPSPLENRPSGGKELFALLSDLAKLKYRANPDELQLEEDGIRVFAGSFYSVEQILRTFFPQTL